MFKNLVLPGGLVFFNARAIGIHRGGVVSYEGVCMRIKYKGGVSRASAHKW